MHKNTIVKQFEETPTTTKEVCTTHLIIVAFIFTLTNFLDLFYIIYITLCTYVSTIASV